MPLYAYKCESCGFAKDALQKMSDAPLTICPNCGADTFRKQVTAAGFQLKGSGWYATDFRGGSGGAGAPSAPPKGEGGEGGDSSKPAAAVPAAAATAAPAGAPAAAPSPAPAPAPAPAAAKKD